MPLSLNEDDGYLLVELAPADGGEPTEVWLDVYESNNVYAHICVEHDDPAARGEAWVKWLAGKGLETSHGTAFLIAEAVAKEVAQFKKKFGIRDSSETPDSPGSSDCPSAADGRSAT